MTKGSDPRPPASRWAQLPTEARHPGSARLDRASTAEVVARVLAEDRHGIERALASAAVIARAADRVADALAAGGSLLLAGAGTSGRLGVLEAAECPPTFGTAPRQVRAAIAGGEPAVFRSREGAEDDEAAGAAAVADATAGDVVLAISASSVTPFARGVLAAGRERGAATILLTCSDGRGLDPLADLVIALDTGPEVLTGSTRLKAGSATKAALNAITTAAMVRLGKVYENLMVDLRAGSAKLADRARRIVAVAGRVTGDEAARLLAAADGEAKTAIAMARLGVDAGEARRRLAAAGGQLWRALDEDR
jgi:N-acetylmuramic acid 6-phosphate etherase